MQPYQMKDSGVEWLGDIPKHWESKPLKRYCEKTSTGKTPDTSKPEYYSEEKGIKWFAPECFSSDKYLTQPKKYLTINAIDNNQAKIYPVNAVYFIGIGATTGKVAISNEKSSANQQINILETNFKQLPSFLFYQLKTIENEIAKFAQYTTLPILNKTKTGYISVTSPPITEQKAIADYLDKACKKIDKTLAIKQQQIDKLEAYRKSVIHEAVTKGLDKNAPIKDSGVEWLGDIPEHWRVRILKRNYSVTLGKMIQPEQKREHDVERPYFRSANLSWEGINDMDVKKCGFNHLS